MANDDDDARPCEECYALVLRTDMDKHMAWHSRSRQQAVTAAADDALQARRESAIGGTRQPRRR